MESHKKMATADNHSLCCDMLWLLPDILPLPLLLQGAEPAIPYVVAVCGHAAGQTRLGGLRSWRILYAVLLLRLGWRCHTYSCANHSAGADVHSADKSGAEEAGLWTIDDTGCRRGSARGIVPPVLWLYPIVDNSTYWRTGNLPATARTVEAEMVLGPCCHTARRSAVLLDVRVWRMGVPAVSSHYGVEGGSACGIGLCMPAACSERVLQPDVYRPLPISWHREDARARL